MIKAAAALVKSVVAIAQKCVFGSDIMSGRLTLISRQGGFLRLSIIGKYYW
jgi:hypothetical protein